MSRSCRNPLDLRAFDRRHSISLLSEAATAHGETFPILERIAPAPSESGSSWRGEFFSGGLVLPAADYEDSRYLLYVGDCRAVLTALQDASAQCCVTSPPYFGLRDYGVDGQIGLESDVEEYVTELVSVFSEVRRVLKDDGVLWLNLGDSYASTTKGGGGTGKSGLVGTPNDGNGQLFASRKFDLAASRLKPKDLIGVPWRVAFALQADGWHLRSDVIWAKPNPMPESVTDRPTKAHEYVFLFTKSERYFYDAPAIAEPATHAGRVLDYTGDQKNNSADQDLMRTRPRDRTITIAETRNVRTVWQIASQPFAGAHFATMPRTLAERCILAGSRPGDTVLDPFNGAGTTGMVAMQRGRQYVGIELNPDYARLAVERWRDRAAQESFL